MYLCVGGHGAVGVGVGLVAELEGHAAAPPVAELLVVDDARHRLDALLHATHAEESLHEGG